LLLLFVSAKKSSSFCLPDASTPFRSNKGVLVDANRTDDDLFGTAVLLVLALVLVEDTLKSRLGNAENTCIWMQASRDRSASNTQIFLTP
jgi:hypothetical protein